MRKGRDGEKKTGKKRKKENTDENSGHYVIASCRPPERRPLECRTLAPIRKYRIWSRLQVGAALHHKTVKDKVKLQLHTCLFLL